MKKIQIKIKQYKLVDLADISGMQKNLKSTDEGKINRLINNIKANGIIAPLFIWNNKIIDGHHRKKAIEEILAQGYMFVDLNDVDVTGKVPIIEIQAETEKEAAKYILAYSSQYATITQDGLQDFVMEFDLNVAELKDEMDFNLDFDLNHLMDVGQEVTEVTEDNYEEPAVIETDIQEGDIYLLGEHRLMCGDSTNAETVNTLLEGKKADMCFTDPPYNTGMSEKTNSDSTWLNHMFNDVFTEEEWVLFMETFTKMYYNVLKQDAVAYVCLDWRRNHELIPFIKKAGFKLSNVIVWDKVVHGLGSDYKYTYELINVCKKGKPSMDTHQGDREYSDVWHIQRKMGKDEDHATKKPLELCERGIRHSSKQGDTVLDLFGGSGSTLIACEQLKRKCYMMELEPKYCQVIIDRWEKLTGKKAIKQ